MHGMDADPKPKLFKVGTGINSFGSTTLLRILEKILGLLKKVG
jgi:hypothetical protein